MLFRPGSNAGTFPAGKARSIISLLIGSLNVDRMIDTSHWVVVRNGAVFLTCPRTSLALLLRQALAQDWLGDCGHHERDLRLYLGVSSRAVGPDSNPRTRGSWIRSKKFLSGLLEMPCFSICIVKTMSPLAVPKTMCSTEAQLWDPGADPHFSDTRESPLLYEGFVFGRPLLLYHSGFHLSQPWTEARNRWLLERPGVHRTIQV